MDQGWGRVPVWWEQEGARLGLGSGDIQVNKIEQIQEV